MGKLSEFALILVLVWLFFPSLSRVVRTILGGGRKTAPVPSPPMAAGEAESLVRCARCGIYVPRSRALAERANASGGALFCSASCREQSRARAAE
jgi:hypothetical protein